MIRQGDSPEGVYNKFIDTNGDGHRGVLLAVAENSTKAIIRAETSAFEGDGGIVKAGNLYLVSETNPNEYPSVVEEVSGVPAGFESV